MPEYRITVRRIGVTGIEGEVLRKDFSGAQQAAERHAADVWSQHGYDGTPGRFRLRLRLRGQDKPIMSIY